MVDSEADASREQLRDEHADIRVLGDFRDEDRRRSLRFDRAPLLLRESDVPGWHFQGPRVVKEFCTNVREGPGNLVSYHAEWVRLSGVLESSSQCHEHRHIVETVRLALVNDQLDASNLLCMEQTVRRLVQIEMAVERCPTRLDFVGLDVLDFVGLDVLTDGAVSSRGAVRTQRFSSWIAERQKERAQVFKQRRQYSEEVASSRRAAGMEEESAAAGGSKKPKGRGRGRGSGSTDKKESG